MKDEEDDNTLGQMMLSSQVIRGLTTRPEWWLWGPLCQLSTVKGSECLLECLKAGALGTM